MIGGVRPPSAHASAHQPPGAGERGQRSTFSKVAIGAAFGAGAVKGMLDRTRIAVKLPEAHRAGRTTTAVRQLLMAAPTTTIIDPSAPRIATAVSQGRSFTHFDERTYRASMLLGASLGAVQLASAVPSLVEALQNGGVRGLVDSREGRTGVAQALGGTVGLGMLGVAAMGARAQGVRGFTPTLMAAAVSPGLTRPWTVALPVVTASFVGVNELGYLDHYNRGDTRTAAQVFADSTERLPLVGRHTTPVTHQVLAASGDARVARAQTERSS